MAKKQSEGEQISSANAVFLGALAPGVNVRPISDSLYMFLYLYDSEQNLMKKVNFAFAD